MTYAFNDQAKGLKYNQYLFNGVNGVNMTTSSEYSTDDRVLQSLESRRVLIIKSDSQTSESSDIMTLAYNSESESNEDVAPYTVTETRVGTDQQQQESHIDLYSRNADVMQDLLTNVCGDNVQCKADATDREQEREATSSASLTQLLSGASSRYISTLSSVSGIDTSALLSSSDISEAMFKEGPQRLPTIPSYILSGRFVHTAENVLISAKDFMQNALQATTGSQNAFDISFIQTPIQNIFQIIYDVEYAFGDLIEDPASSVSVFATATRQITSDFADIFENEATEEHHKALTSQHHNGESASLHTFNNFKLEIPYADANADQCTWLLVSDLPEGIIDAYLTKSSLFIAFMNAVLEIQTDGTVKHLSADNEFVQVEFPFEFGLMMCSKSSDSDVDCNGMFSNIKVRVGEGVTSLYGEISSMMVPELTGLLGAPGASADVVDLIKMDMRHGANFLNIFELSQDPECKIPTQVFNTNNRFILQQHDPIETPLDSQCMTNEDGELNYQSVDHGHVIVMVSLSEETIDMNPFATLETLASSLSSNGVSNEQFSLVSFDGQKQRYNPFFMTMDNQVSSNIEAFQSVVNVLEFNGPSYDASNTKTALAELVQSLNSQPGALKRIVLFAPEITDPASLIDSSTAEMLTNQLTEVYFMSNSETNEDHVYQTNEVSELANVITRNLNKSLRRSTECACEQDSTSQQMTTTCRFV
jgi:hypothetical protein